MVWNFFHGTANSTKGKLTFTKTIMKFPATATSITTFDYTDNEIFVSPWFACVVTAILATASTFFFFKSKLHAPVKDRVGEGIINSSPAGVEKKLPRIRMNQVRKVCLFGISANPPTKSGHTSIVSSLSLLRCSENSNSPKQFDEIRVLPVFKHMYSVSFVKLGKT